MLLNVLYDVLFFSKVIIGMILKFIFPIFTLKRTSIDIPKYSVSFYRIDSNYLRWTTSDIFIFSIPIVSFNIYLHVENDKFLAKYCWNFSRFFKILKISGCWSILFLEYTEEFELIGWKLEAWFESPYETLFFCMWNYIYPCWSSLCDSLWIDSTYN